MRTWVVLWIMIMSSPLSAAEPALLIAHRGASHDAPENTLAAFRLAWKKDADGIEGDFYLTRDGRVVCIHDKTTKRTAGTNLTVDQTTLADLRKLDVGNWKDKRFAGETIPTLEEVLATVPKGKRFYLEVKCGPEIVPVLKPILAKSNVKSSQIAIISFSSAVIAQVRKQIPDVKAYWLTGYRKRKGEWEPTATQVVQVLKKIDAHGLGSQANRSVVNADFVRTLKDADKEIHVWTVDAPKDADYFQALGVGSITTNRPAILRQAR